MYKRQGSSGAAVSLVDREELKFLKDIEKLIKREIPKLPVEGFTPNPNPEPEAPRAPRQPHGRPPRGNQRSAGSTGAAVSLVDREELKFLKDIEKLIKREIPKLPVEGFTPNPNPEPEAPRAPRQAHGRPPRGHQRSAGAAPGQSQRPRDGSKANNPRQEGRPAPNQAMSEAARHQAMPQAALFSPTVPQNNGRRHNPNGDQPRSNQSRPGQARPGQSRPGQANHGKPSSPNRSGGRGR